MSERLEALAAVLAAEKHAIPPELASRDTAAMRTILDALDGMGDYDPKE